MRPNGYSVLWVFTYLFFVLSLGNLANGQTLTAWALVVITFAAAVAVVVAGLRAEVRAGLHPLGQ